MCAAPRTASSAHLSVRPTLGGEVQRSWARIDPTPMTTILAIETSCDETSAAVVVDGRLVRSNVISSQVEIHARYGGIVPEIASRQHVLQIEPVILKALADADAAWTDLDAIAVTVGPGLAGALLVGVNAAKGLSVATGLPLLPVNHLEAHVYANWLETDPPDFPFVCLIASGGHTDLVLMRGHGDYEMLGRTRDDAAGEAFDKVARVLGLGYPGGPIIQRVAEQATAPRALPRAWLRGTHDFSFSGLKTATLHLAQDVGLCPSAGEPLLVNGAVKDREAETANVAAGFQEAVVDVLVEKSIEAASSVGASSIALAGGVAANKPLRARLAARANTPVHIPPPVFCTDNAAMVAACAYFTLSDGSDEAETSPTPLSVDVSPALSLASA